MQKMRKKERLRLILLVFYSALGQNSSIYLTGNMFSLEEEKKTWLPCFEQATCAMTIFQFKLLVLMY